MRRTSITTMALSALALAAVAGCVSVDQGATPPPSGPGPAGAHRTPSIPPPVEGPAREALEAALPAAASAPPRTGPPAAGSAPRAQPPSAVPAAGRHRDGDGDDSRPGRPGKRPSADRVRVPRPQVGPPAVPTAPVTDLVPEVCALGGRYGGWPTGSPQARICREAYGH